MTDDLRTRIIAVLEENFDAAAPSLSMVDMADAVIADLDSRGWLIDPESEDRRRRARNKRWLEGNDDHD